MPRINTPVLAWSSTGNHYNISPSSLLPDSAAGSFEPGAGGEMCWLDWLASHSTLNALVFHGQAGHLNLLKEKRARGRSYWYAYFYTDHTTLKRYLGATYQLTFARLEDLAGELTTVKSKSEPARMPPVVPEAAQRTLLTPAPALTQTQISTTNTKETGKSLSLGSLEQPVKALYKGQTLLMTKLTAPVLPTSLVSRARLLAGLKAATSKPLTLVCATAGWGKTTLLAEWIATATTTTRIIPNQPLSLMAWLSLDSLDNDLPLFWVLVISALQRVVPHLGETALALLRSAQPAGITAVLTALLNELASLQEETKGSAPNPIILALDDYQLIEEPSIHESFAFWLEHLPTNVRVIIASRFDPPFPLAKWRVKGLLAEIRAEELGFTLKETGLFLENNGESSLSPEEVTTLGNRTQGWAAGLQLAAISLEKKPQADKPHWIANFTGNNRYLLDYIEEEVLSHQPETLQQFLLNTAILTRLNAEVCQAVSGNTNSQELLNTLERNNLFIIPLDDQRQWYRYHDLFRDVLLAQLHLKQPKLIEELHTRAAHWYAGHNEGLEAISHAFGASNFWLAAALVKQEAPQFWLSGQAQAVFNWIELLPDEVLKETEYTLLALEAGRSLVNSLYGTPQAVQVKIYAHLDQLVNRLEKILFQLDKVKPIENSLDQSGAEMLVIKRRIGLLRALMTARTLLSNDDVTGFKQLVEEMQELGEDEDLDWRLVELMITFWLTESLERRGIIMVPRLLEVREQAVRERNYPALIRIKNRLALAYSSAGKVRLSAQESAEGLALLRQTGELSINEGFFHLFYSEFFVEQYRLDEARHELQEALRVANLWQWIDILLISYVEVASIEMAQGDLAAAGRTLQQAEEIVEREPYFFYPEWVTGQRVLYWLANGELNRARQWAEKVELSVEGWHYNQFYVFIAQVQVFLHLGHYRRAIEVLETFNPLLDRPNEDGSRTTTFLATYFVALHLAGKTTQTQSVALRLFALTQPEGNLWAFLIGGEPMRQALQSLLVLPASNKSDSSLENELETSRLYVEELLKAFERYSIPGKVPNVSTGFLNSEQGGSKSPMQSQPQVSAFADDYFVNGSGEPLSPQEQRVLRLLVSGLTYGEIAEELVVSPNTIKTQVSSIYRKLGVRRRSEVVEVARRRKLV